MDPIATTRPTPQKGFLRTRRWVGDNLANESVIREALMFITAVRPATLRGALEADLRDTVELARLAANPCHYGHTFTQVLIGQNGQEAAHVDLDRCAKCGARKPPPAYEAAFEEV